MDSYIQFGDLIIFDDKHCLLCGDSRDSNSYRHLTEKASIVLTSPPYNAGSREKTDTSQGSSYKYIDKKADDLKDEEYYDLICSVMDNCLENANFIFWNTMHISGNKITHLDFLHKYKYDYVDTMIWVKTIQSAVRENCLNSDFEYIYI